MYKHNNDMQLMCIEDIIKQAFVTFNAYARLAPRDFFPSKVMCLAACPCLPLLSIWFCPLTIISKCLCIQTS